MSSKISWTDQTWNPIVGCSKCSPGCKNCYAERMARRQAFMRPVCEYADVVGESGWNGKTALVKSALTKPLHWKKPRRIFVCSMGDRKRHRCDWCNGWIEPGSVVPSWFYADDGDNPFGCDCGFSAGCECGWDRECSHCGGIFNKCRQSPIACCPDCDHYTARTV
jgi:hypothetical protein